MFRLGHVEKDILAVAGLGMLALASLAAPNLPKAIQSIVKLRGNKWLNKKLYEMKKKGLIDLGGEEVKLTAKGKKMLQDIELSELNIAKPKRWDGTWRLVSYDIPERLKKARNLFRYVLEKNGFHQIQESLWVHPYPCKEEVAVLAKNVNIARYVIVMETDKLPNEKNMQEHFLLSDLD